MKFDLFGYALDCNDEVLYDDKDSKDILCTDTN